MIHHFKFVCKICAFTNKKHTISFNIVINFLIVDKLIESFEVNFNGENMNNYILANVEDKQSLLNFVCLSNVLHIIFP